MSYFIVRMAPFDPIIHPLEMCENRFKFCQSKTKTKTINSDHREFNNSYSHLLSVEQVLGRMHSKCERWIIEAQVVVGCRRQGQTFLS